MANATLRADRITRLRAEAALCSTREDAVEHVLEAFEEAVFPNVRLLHFPGIRLTVLQRNLLAALLDHEGELVSRHALKLRLWSAEDQPGQPEARILKLVHQLSEILEGVGLIFEAQHGDGIIVTRQPGTVLPWEETEVQALVREACDTADADAQDFDFKPNKGI